MPDSSKHKTPHPPNPPNCWPLFSIYILYLFTFIAIVLAIILKISLNLDYSLDTVPSNLATFECCSYLFAVIGFIIFTIRPTILFIKHIFEEITEKDSFYAHITILIRSQWFLLLLTVLFTAMKDNFFLFEPVTFVLFLINFITDLNFTLNNDNEKEPRVLNLFSIVTGLLMMGFLDWECKIYFGSMKMLFIALNYYWEIFKGQCEDRKIRRKVGVMNVLLMINVYLVGFGLLQNMRCFVNLGSRENGMFLSVWKLMKLMFLPNLAKIIPYFI